MASYGDAELEAPNSCYGANYGFRFTETAKGIRIHRREFVVFRSVGWVGNWSWNRYIFDRLEAKRLLFTLRKNGWCCTLGPSLLCRWFNKEARD